MSVEMRSVREEGAVDTREWFDAITAGPLRERLPEPNEDYFYVATRLISWFPVVNLKGATYESADFNDDLLKTLVGKQANLFHDKVKQVVGRVVQYEQTNDGVDVIIEVDREQAEAHGFDPMDTSPGNAFSSVSVELTKDPSQSFFYAYDDGFNVQRRIPVPVGRELGVRRTTVNDPYRLQGNRVAERIKPVRFTGVGFVPNPADTNATVYAVAADDTSPERVKMAHDPKKPYGDVHYADPAFQADGVHRYPIDTPEHIRSAARYFGKGKNRDEYTPEQRAHIDKQIAEAKKIHGIGDTDEQAAVADLTQGDINMSEADVKALQDKVTLLEAQVASLTTEKEAASAEAAKVADLVTKVASLETELASVTSERDALNSEKETAAREARIAGIVTELEAIRPCKDDAERTALRETAASYCDDAGVIHRLKLERTIEAQSEKIAALEAAKSGENAPAGEGTPAGEGGTEGETASADAETFSGGERPVVPLAPVYSAAGKTSKYSPEELDAAF